MDHAEALALIEEAALEPGGLERLMAGDTPLAAALAGHLAGCPDCTRELGATGRTVEALRLVAATRPPDDLRARTLSLVAAVGRARGAAPGMMAAAPAPGAIRRSRGLALLAAAAVFALFAAGSFVAADLQGQVERTRAEAAHLHELYATMEALLQEPGARLVALRGVGGQVGGVLVMDAGSHRLAVLSDDLSEPSAGMEYRCWVEIAGQREPVGRMWFEEGLAYWSGAMASVGEWPSGATFGVSLEEADQPASGAAVLWGGL